MSRQSVRFPRGCLGMIPTCEGTTIILPRPESFWLQAGYPNGTGFPVVQLWSNQQAESTKAELAAYQRYLADIGVQVEIHFAPDWRRLSAAGAGHTPHVSS